MRTGAAEEQVQSALTSLQTAIKSRVRAEQLRDQMTGLANGAALSDVLKHRLQSADPFWVAFIEVDGFKAINQRFGYDQADELLRSIADYLGQVGSIFPGEVEAFRAHGDEFYLVGLLGKSQGETTSDVELGLGLVSQSVAQRRIYLEKLGEMRCTVSIGWLLNSDVTYLDVRHILGCLELAVAEAKHKHSLIRYSTTLSERDLVDWRIRCPSCECGFTMIVPRAAHRRDEPTRCPNCAVELPRPAEKPKPQNINSATIPSPQPAETGGGVAAIVAAG